MCADHHDLIAEIAAGDLGYRVVTHKIVLVEARVQIDRNCYGHALLDEPDDPVILLKLSGKLRYGLWCICRSYPESWRRRRTCSRRRQACTHHADRSSIDEETRINKGSRTLFKIETVLALVKLLCCELLSSR